MDAKVEASPNGGRPSRSQWSDDLAGAINVPPVSVAEHDRPCRDLIASGMLLGAMAGCVSLMVNVIGSVALPAITGEPQHPLRLIQIYLTFPLGETALRLDGGLTMAAGCGLYLLTGVIYGVIFEFVLSTYFPRAGLGARLLMSSALMLVVWIINFYAILSWLQPLLLGGRWIVELIPWWVAGLTHLVFGWTMAAIHPTQSG
jgi:hypothetical protein